MKKLLLSTFVMVLALYSYGQGIIGGVKGGMNFADQKYTSDGFSAATKVRPGIHLGVYALYMINEQFGIQPELLFAMQGSRWEIGGDGKFKFNYINLPILVRYNITEMISIHLGPQFGFLLSAEVEDDGDTEDIKDLIKGMDIGAATGAEYELPNGLGFGARFVLGFSNIADPEDPDDDVELKNRTFQLYVKYILFGKK